MFNIFISIKTNFEFFFYRVGEIFFLKQSKNVEKRNFFSMHLKNVKRNSKIVLSQNAELENCFAEKTNRENTGTREKIEESFISDIVFENRELPCKSAAESSCFCFKMCL